jgi:hypothetical protein
LNIYPIHVVFRHQYIPVHKPVYIPWPIGGGGGSGGGRDTIVVVGSGGGGSGSDSDEK